MSVVSKSSHLEILELLREFTSHENTLIASKSYVRPYLSDISRSCTIESLGPLTQKIQVNACEKDAYRRFEKTMSECKKESEKRTTQILDRNGIGTKISSKLVRAKNNSSLALAASAGVHAAGSPSSSSSSFLSSSSYAKFPSAHSYRSSSRSPSSSLPPNHPILDRKQNKPPLNGNPELMRRPLKERLIHHLAVRPYKKPELLSRIQRDGLKDRDKKNVSVIMKQVSFMKDNTYHLLRHLWNDVSEDWPFYSEQDRQSFRRRKPQNLTPPGSDGSTCSSGHSPSSTHPASPSSSTQHHHHSSVKRPYEVSAVIPEPPSKRKRVSNFIRPTTGGGGGGGGANDSSPRNVVVAPSSSTSSTPPPPPTTTTSSYKNKNSPHDKTTNWLNNHHHKTDRPNTNLLPLTVKNTDYKTEFTPITTKEQRILYKMEFNKNYQRYRELHKTVEKVSRRFAQLEEQLKEIKARGGKSDESLKKLMDTISSDYASTSKDPIYVKDRNEFQYLHEKLAYIKKLVSDYDMDNLKSNGGRTRSPVVSAMS